MPIQDMKYTVGVDVGTGSVRAALVQSDGRIVATESRPLKIWNPQPDFYEQSSDDVWEGVCSTVKVFIHEVPCNLCFFVVVFCLDFVKH